MRQAILTKYFGPTNSRGARVKVWCAGKTQFYSWDHSLGISENHTSAANALFRLLGWNEHNDIHGGALPDNTGYCFVLTEKERES